MTHTLYRCFPTLAEEVQADAVSRFGRSCWPRVPTWVAALIVCGVGCVTAVRAAENHVSRVNEVGPVRVTTTLKPREPTIGDELVLEIKVEAAPEVDVLMPEFGEALSRYTIVDYVPRQQVADDGSTIHVQRYTLQGDLSGEQSIPPILVEFVDNRPGRKPSPDDLDAYEILTDRIDFQVESVLPENATGELNPPLGKLRLADSPRGSGWGWTVAGSFLGILAVVVGGVVWWSRRRRVSRRNAYEIARARLDELLSRGTPREEAGIEAFFVEISAIIRRYLEDRFELRAPELTTEEFLGVAGNSGALSREHQRLLHDFLRQADLVKFAGARAGEQEIRKSTDVAMRFLDETRAEAPLIDVSDGSGKGEATACAATRLSADRSAADAREKANV